MGHPTFALYPITLHLKGTCYYSAFIDKYNVLEMTLDHVSLLPIIQEFMCKMFDVNCRPTPCLILPHQK
jgi:hypothetical protein